MDNDTLAQFDDIDKSLRDIIYFIKSPEHVLLDLDSTLFESISYGIADAYMRVGIVKEHGYRVFSVDERELVQHCVNINEYSPFLFAII